ncbi:hypothetical protein GCM10010965_29370 [Caldalkalibacillus thermarum]|nr:hypothetical protein GCM10010965_29370 [Caldalkalibacillus thermarum]
MWLFCPLEKVNNLFERSGIDEKGFIVKSNATKEINKNHGNSVMIKLTKTFITGGITDGSHP